MSSIALVTGGNRGIGLAIAQSLKAAGHDVVVTYRSGSAPEGFKAVQMDVTSTESVDAGFASIEDQWGAPEIIVAKEKKIYDITNAPKALTRDQAGRQKRYFISMMIRTACFILTVILPSPYRWFALLGAVTLPYFAVDGGLGMGH